MKEKSSPSQVLLALLFSLFLLPSLVLIDTPRARSCLFLQKPACSLPCPVCPLHVGNKWHMIVCCRCRGDAHTREGLGAGEGQEGVFELL